jgi:hypothetical protein
VTNNLHPANRPGSASEYPQTIRDLVESPTSKSVWSRKTVSGLVALLLISGALRLACMSKLYFADGPRLVRAIESGKLVIQPPGYYLFNLSGLTLSHLFHCSAAHALALQNLLFGELAVLFFALLCLRRLSQGQAFLLAACYAVSPAIWFVADVHSSYASATAFAPLLFLCCEDWDMFPLGCFFWALMAGFRPSDGVFVLPWIIWQGFRRSWAIRLRGAALAVPVLLAWIIPTANRFGGWKGLLQSNHSQAASVAQGILTGHISIHSAMEVVRATAGLLLGWGLLLPLVIVAFVARSKTSVPIRSALIWIAPGLLFFTLYFVADPVYVDYLIAPGLIAVGYMLQDWSPRSRRACYLATITASFLFMFFARPTAGTGKGAAVVNAYVFPFTRWSLEHQYKPRLAVLLGACGQPNTPACEVNQ